MRLPTLSRQASKPKPCRTCGRQFAHAASRGEPDCFSLTPLRPVPQGGLALRPALETRSERAGGLRFLPARVLLCGPRWRRGARGRAGCPPFVLSPSSAAGDPRVLSKDDKTVPFVSALFFWDLYKMHKYRAIFRSNKLLRYFVQDRRKKRKRSCKMENSPLLGILGLRY